MRTSGSKVVIDYPIDRGVIDLIFAFPSGFEYDRLRWVVDLLIGDPLCDNEAYHAIKRVKQIHSGDGLCMGRS